MSIEPPIRIMALHALLYCERLFYLEEVEEIRVASDRVYAGRELHASLAVDEGDAWEQFEAESPRLGICGKLDCLRRRDGHLIPYEHKRGRCRREDGKARAWPSDEIQAVAYAALVSDVTAQRVDEARIHYHADNVTVRVPYDDDAVVELQRAIKTACRLRESVERPPVADNERLCVRCSLAPICLPEETRSCHCSGHVPKRLFPTDDDRTVLHVSTAGASIGRRANELVIKPPKSSDNATQTRHAIRSVGAVVLHGQAQISTQALRLCCSEGISIHWVGYGGNYIAGTQAGMGAVQRRIRQYRALCSPVMRMRLARLLVHAKVQGQHRFLLRATRGNEQSRKAITRGLLAISQSLHEIKNADNPATLRGIEGDAANRYFNSLNSVLSSRVPQSLHYNGRSRRPPRDRFNAALSYGYALLYGAVVRSILAVGLEPALGFFHRPRSAAHPLVLDLMEIFRVVLWDMVLIGSINRSQWDPDHDFNVTPAGVWLSESGRKKAIGLFEGRLAESWKHPVLGYSLSYARTLELEVRLLEKEWSGEGGVFAQSRIR